MSHLDGNVLAGPLSELFKEDLTVASGRCLGCGDEAVLARAMVYAAGPGYVVRCRECDSVLMIVVNGPGDVRLDMRGISILRVPN